MANVVEISGLDFAYGKQKVLQGIDLAVAAGTTLGLIGPNGGGKTTLIRLLLGMLKPTAGTIRIAGMAPRQAIRQGDLIGYLPQNPRVADSVPLNVRQVVRLGLVGKTGLLRSHTREDLEFVEQLLKRVGIFELADQPIGSLSGGQMQRAFIARALAPRPKLLLLDEPTTGIDRAGQQQFI